DLDERRIGWRVNEARAVEARRVAASAAGAMALNAHAVEKLLAGVDVGLALRRHVIWHCREREQQRARTHPSFSGLHSPQPFPVNTAFPTLRFWAVEARRHTTLADDSLITGNDAGGTDRAVRFCRLSSLGVSASPRC